LVDLVSRGGRVRERGRGWGRVLLHDAPDAADMAEAVADHGDADYREAVEDDADADALGHEVADEADDQAGDEDADASHHDLSVGLQFGDQQVGVIAPDHLVHRFPELLELWAAEQHVQGLLLRQRQLEIGASRKEAGVADVEVPLRADCGQLGAILAGDREARIGEFEIANPLRLAVLGVAKAL